MMVLVQGAAMLLFLGLGLLWPRAGVPVLGRETWINLATGAALFGLKVGVVTAVGVRAGPGLIDLSGLSSPVVQLGVVFVLGDLARYWLHRAHHEVGFLWQFHRTHHSSEVLNATSGLRMHLVDFIQLVLLPWLLFGVLLDTSSFDGRVWVALGTIVAGMDAFQHADLRFPLTHPLARAWHRVLNNPHFHSWHHSRDPYKLHGNYGQTLIVWDRWFGTAIEEPEPARALGLSGDQALEASLAGLQLLRRPV